MAKQNVYASITAKIVAALEDGVRPWARPWNAEHAAGRITRPLRHNRQPYTGINILGATGIYIVEKGQTVNSVTDAL